MNTKKLIIGITGMAAAFALLLTGLQGQGPGHGMSPEVHNTIHSMFDSHAKFEREVTQTEEGYISKTTSSDPAAVNLLQSHVKQMEARLNDGLRVRGWDPAYAEFVDHYDDISITVRNIANGIEVVAVGKTEEAKNIARNHAAIVSKFVERGWEEHDVSHPAVGSGYASSGKGPGCGQGCSQGEGDSHGRGGKGDSCGSCATGGEAKGGACCSMPHGK